MLALPEAANVITLYHAPMSRSVRVRWLLEELGLPHQVETRALAELKQPEHVALHPLGKVPVLVDGDLVLLESGAIVQYLLESYGHGRLEPKLGSPERPAFLQWIHFAEATLTPPLGLLAQHTLIRRPEDRIPAIVPDATRLANSALQVVDAALDGREWLTGEFSAADVMMGYSISLANLFKLVTDELPNVKAYLARCSARPAFRRSTST
jgi:glutathione S-transferase